VSRGAVAATDLGAAAAAREVLEDWGSAADALVAGWFALAGAEAEGLFASAVALVAGPGAGARVFDGRALQPGRGLGRPRGLQHGEVVPAAARAAVPRALGAMALLHRQRGRLPFAKLVDAGALAALHAGAPAREETLRRVAAEGPSAMVRDRLRNALLAAAGPLARGTLTGEDLAEARAEDRPADADVIEGSVLVTPGTLGGEAAPTGPRSMPGRLEAITAVDAQGVAACLVAWFDAQGVLVPELEVALPACGEPVRRGVARKRPGEILWLPTPLAIVEREEVRVGLAGVRHGALVLEDLVALAAEPTLESGFARLAARGGSIAVVSDTRATRVAIGSAT